MAAQASADVLAVELEKVRKKIPLLYERDDVLLTMIQKRGDVEKVSSRNMRLPLKITSGGKAGAFDPNGGDMGRGSSTAYAVAQVSPIFFRHAVEVNKIVEYATDSPEKAVASMVKENVTDGMAQFRTFLDQIMNTAGNCVIGTITSVSGAVLTMTVPFGAALVYIGQTVQVYDATLATNRGTAVVVAFDSISTTQTITLDAAPGGTTGTDLLVYDGVSGANPVGLYGIQYHQSNAVTGTWLGLNRATYPQQLQTPAVNAASSALVPQNVRLAKNKIRKALGVKSGKKLIAYAAVEQANAWENLGIAISSIIKQGGTGSADSLDLLFAEDKMTLDGTPFTISIHADQTRIDFLDLSQWGRAEMKAIDLYEVGGQTVWPIYGGSGGIAAAQIFYFSTGFQIWNQSPRSGAYIYSLSRPSGY